MIACDQICKRFGDRRVLEDVSFTIERGAFSILLGPSGCGKTLLLSILAGLEAPSSGRVLIGGSDMTRVPPERRPVTMVFQRHALFPHLTVSENIAFSMRARHLHQGAIRSRVEDLLGLIDLESYRHATPDVLSGGQCQRVAFARALASDAEVVLFDEPLNSLDKGMKSSLVAELKKWHKIKRFTALYVTHDLEEAFALGTRMLGMKKGKVAQTALERGEGGSLRSLNC